MIHPTNRRERLLSAQKKERVRQTKTDKAGRVRTRLTREALKAKELEDAVQLAGSDQPESGL